MQYETLFSTTDDQSNKNKQYNHVHNDFNNEVRIGIDYIGCIVE